MTCPNCQEETDEAAFCGFCGKGTALVRKKDATYSVDEQVELIGSVFKLALKAGVALIVLYLFIGFITNGGFESRELSPEEKKEAIRECKDWGGTVVYDSKKQYRDCY